MDRKQRFSAEGSSKCDEETLITDMAGRYFVMVIEGSPL